MKVVVVGATGNVGTSVVEALSACGEVEEIVGLARRRPGWSPPKTRWVEADVIGSDLSESFAGADAVVHLAWAIQPSHDAQTLEQINVDGSRRVFEAVAEAGVGRLVYASSIGAYSAGPKDTPVDESWPVDGTPSSFYSRHKATVEKMLDRFESENPGIAVVRLRPGLIFRDEAANEIRRLFVGPFLPNFLIKPGLVPALPRLRGLRVQAVHSADVGQAYLLGVLADVRGAFNIAAEPPLDSERLAALLGAARTFPVPTGLARGLAAATWRLRLQPTSPGWLDMAMNVPLMDTGRARRELGWTPKHTALEAVEELLEGMREGDGHRTPPLEGDSVSGRIDDVRK